MQYSILTKMQVSQSFEDESFDFDALTLEQDEKLALFGFCTFDGSHLVRFLDSDDFEEMTIEDALQHLSIKEGADLVGLKTETLVLLPTTGAG